ncbi:hypothetical protein HMPREF9440_00668 [Sutterella parvirubra YIT 11816]|uniref:Uncharacterized protein n=1 Tax=Sutterella parvirubra YIT 11816 TaxID=762967 RepID=H3KD62_9BURK|nr:hypothetical protein HMPREF9440_00668 [Sutterella parvirubra YIT 11816]
MSGTRTQTNGQPLEEQSPAAESATSLFGHLNVAQFSQSTDRIVRKPA